MLLETKTSLLPLGFCVAHYWRNPADTASSVLPGFLSQTFLACEKRFSKAQAAAQMTPAIVPSFFVRFMSR